MKDRKRKRHRKNNFPFNMYEPDRKIIIYCGKIGYDYWNKILNEK